MMWCRLSPRLPIFPPTSWSGPKGAIFTEISSRTLEDIQTNRAAFNEGLTERLAEVLNGYGVQILQGQLTEFAPCRAYAINGHAAVGNYSLWTGF